MVFFAACGASPRKVTEELGQCLHPGKTTFAEAVLCLGVPMHSFEDGHILVYPGRRVDYLGGVSVVRPPRSGLENKSNDLDFVLTFDQGWVLRDFRTVSPLPGI